MSTLLTVTRLDGSTKRMILPESGEIAWPYNALSFHIQAGDDQIVSVTLKLAKPNSLKKVEN
jgi:hypothetical protein